MCELYRVVLTEVLGRKLKAHHVGRGYPLWLTDCWLVLALVYTLNDKNLALLDGRRTRLSSMRALCWRTLFSHAHKEMNQVESVLVYVGNPFTTFRARGTSSPPMTSLATCHTPDTTTSYYCNCRYLRLLRLQMP